MIVTCNQEALSLILSHDANYTDQGFLVDFLKSHHDTGGQYLKIRL
jgi:hypothetical protein